MTMSEQTSSVEFPQIVLVDLSTACNATCVMCPTQLNPLRKKMMDPALFESVVEQVSKFPVHPVNNKFFIGVHGEPLLDKRLAEKIALCRSRGINHVLISTNGSLMTAQRARDILEAEPYIIVISLESMDPKLFESIRKGLRHDVVVENLKSLLAIRNELNSSTRIGVRFIESVRNAHERETFQHYWAPHLNSAKQDYFSIDRIHNWAYGDPGKFYGNSPCGHTTGMTILSDGDVVFCCLDHEGVHHLGNAYQHSLLEIFNCEKARKMRAIHFAGQRHTLEMCKTCDVAEQWAGHPIAPIYNDFIAEDWVRMPGGV